MIWFAKVVLFYQKKGDPLREGHRKQTIALINDFILLGAAQTFGKGATAFLDLKRQHFLDLDLKLRTRLKVLSAQFAIERFQIRLVHTSNGIDQYQRYLKIERKQRKKYVRLSITTKRRAYSFQRFIIPTN